MTREERENTPHPAPAGTLAWEQQHDYLEPDRDSEYPAGFLSVQSPPKE